LESISLHMGESGSLRGDFRYASVQLILTHPVKRESNLGAERNKNEESGRI
jgi:hypothetical protein